MQYFRTHLKITRKYSIHRILGAEMWHREKDFLTKELYQLQKVKMQQVLQEIEQDEINRFDQQFYGEIAYRNWLQDKGLEEPKDAEIQNEKSETFKKEPQESLLKANAVQSPPKVKSSYADKQPDNVLVSSGKRVPKIQESGNGDLQEKQEDNQTSNQKQNRRYKFGEGLVEHENPWNISTHTPPHECPPRLADYYPRDEYTMQPKYPLKKGGRSAPNINMVPIKHENTRSAAKLRKPKLPPEMLEKVLMEGTALQDRPVVYKCKNIIDMPKLKPISREKLPKSETALHLCDDKNSALFKAALQQPMSELSVSNTSLRSTGSTSSSSRLSVNFSELSLTSVIKT